MLFSKTTQWKEIFEHKHERQKKKKGVQIPQVYSATVPERHGQGRPGDEQHDLAKHRH